MRRPLLLALLALAAAPAPASAEGFRLWIGAPGPGVQLSNFEECPATTCAPSPVELRLERGGAVIAAAGPDPNPIITTPVQPGDTLRILRDGVERVAWQHGAEPLVDDTSCLVVGGTTLTGTFRRGEPGFFSLASPGYGLAVDDHTYLRFALDTSAGIAEAAIATEGDRWTATFPRPLERGDRLLVANGYTAVTPAGHATITSARWERVCPPEPAPPAPPPPPPAACTATGLRDAPATRAAVRRAVAALTARALRRGTAVLRDLPACAGGKVEAKVSTAGRRAVVVGRGNVRAGTELTAVPLDATARIARLARGRGARVSVWVRFTDAAGGRATLVSTARSPWRRPA